MGIRTLNETEYYRSVYGGWLGKNIGGTLGAPAEGKKELLDLTFYPALPDGPLENDDLDLQLVSLHALEQYGPKLTSRELGQEWVEHVFFPYDEYGYALTNLRRGLIPPVAGSFGNPFVDCMGSPIRSELWGMVAPGAPHVAAHYAYHDASVDHAGGEGVYGEMFFAALESAVFLEKDRDRLIALGLSYIPETCRTARALNDLLAWHRQGKTWTEARALILERHGRDNFTDAPQNVAFTILGWLYGDDFEDAILKAVNCGYDTDCTAATLGAILGMIAGPEGLPDKWAKPVGDRVVVSPPIKGFPAPKTLDELTRRTMRMGKQVLAAWDTGILIRPDLPTDRAGATLEPDASVRELWARNAAADRRPLPRGSAGSEGLELIVDYGAEGPAVGREREKTIALTIVNRSTERWDGTLELEAPAGWTVDEAQPFRVAAGASQSFAFRIRSGTDVRPSYELTAVVTRLHDGSAWSRLREPIVLTAAAEWTVWGPEDEAGTPAVFGGNRLDWAAALRTEKNGTYRARTRLRNPLDRTVRLIVASCGAVVASLNGVKVVDCEEKLELMPAYHRAPSGHVAELTLAAGDHELEIAVRRDGPPPETYVLTVAPKRTESPGSYYYYTDILFTTE